MFPRSATKNGPARQAQARRCCSIDLYPPQPGKRLLLAGATVSQIMHGEKEGDDSLSGGGSSAAHGGGVEVPRS